MAYEEDLMRMMLSDPSSAAMLTGVPAAQKGVGRIDPAMAGMLPATVDDAEPVQLPGSQGPISSAKLPASPEKPNFFKNMLKNFLSGVSEGFAGAAGIPSDYERQLESDKMGFQQKQFEEQQALRETIAQSNAAYKEQLAAQNEAADLVLPNKQVIAGIPRKFHASILNKWQETTSREKVEGAKIEADKPRKASLTQLAEAQRELTQARTEAQRAGIDPKSPLFQQKERAIQARIQAARESASLSRERFEYQKQKGLMPTSATRTMSEAAPKVNQFIERILPIIEAEADGLGPMSSRWRELWAGKVGAEDTEFTKLRTNVGLLNTLLLRMHVGARGGQQMLEHFKGLLDSGKQSPQNMLAALEEIESYANDVANMGVSGPTSEGRITVISPDGKEGTIPASQWAEARKKGFKKK